MNPRELHLVAARIHREAGLLDESGSLLRKPVDVEHIAEHARQLTIVGAERRGLLRLPSRRKGQIRIDRGLIIVRSDLLDDSGKEIELQEVLAHEVAHHALHGSMLAQRPLPFGALDDRKLGLGRMAFSRSDTDTFEREAIYLGALLQVPVRELKQAVRPAVRSYGLIDWTHLTDASVTAEKAASKRYREHAVQLVVDTFAVTPNTAKIALDYWHAAIRPPLEWIKEGFEAC